ncbi:motility associated factor glycosyltransferase family protein [Campylobacter cuniculorum]|uniref:Putative pseudaminic acid transferase n=1 Tax=Campylobacter cuniculorum DSM 23162 = LMG 24588 TaxID=1121267 RepID=A0A1W6BXS7_9BACT|nr:motility associated factor glycosyltransferase family protein [Campylobacter cuniculorum]ARJ56926.1 putative pseudaminic acid transferase [Campylobacter cuniculorum DSM 23162 = LMG 24588]
MQTGENFKKNLIAMNGDSYKELKEKLENLKELRDFSFNFGKDNLDINIIQKRTLKTMYKNPVEELEKSLEELKPFARYPALFFYGFGNGILFKALLKNQNHRRIVVFENELELIFLALNFIDFSSEIATGRLIIIHTKDLDPRIIQKIFSLVNPLFLKTYNLHITCDFYEAYKEDILRLNKLNSSIIMKLSLTKGNDPIDVLIGIDYAIQHIPKTITHPSLKELIKKRSRLGKTAIIVATGPSLTKQLPLLKQYANKAAIFCADSSYPILAKNNIKPDYVLSLERGALTSEFFNNDFGAFDKDILFIPCSLTHSNSIKYLEQNKREYMLVERAQPFLMSLQLNDFGFIGGGMSVAHMAYEFAARLGYKNILLIGQDLAYGEDGYSHTKDYQNLNIHKGHYERDFGKFTTTAYGGQGQVESSQVWTLFRQIFENYSYNPYVKLYNCTEGGARIEGTIEMPFKEACETLLDEELKKPFRKLKKLPRKRQNEIALNAYNIIKKNISLGKNLVKEAKKIQGQIKNLFNNKNKLTLDEINLNIDKFKTKLETPRYSAVRQILGPTFHHEQNVLAPLYFGDITNESERQNKLIAWIYAHNSLFESIVEILNAQNEVLKNSVVPLREFLEKRKIL